MEYMYWICTRIYMYVINIYELKSNNMYGEMACDRFGGVSP